MFLLVLYLVGDLVNSLIKFVNHFAVLIDNVCFLSTKPCDLLTESKMLTTWINFIKVTTSAKEPINTLNHLKLIGDGK